jgi:TolA-binding protein
VRVAMLVFFLAFSGVGGVVGCAPDRGSAYQSAVAAAMRAETAGRFGEAAARFDDAAANALVARDAAHAKYLAAAMLQRSGARADALARLDAIAAAKPAQADSASAALRAAEMRIAAGDADGWRRLEDMVVTFPNSGAARPALHRLLRHDDETGGPATAIAHLRVLEKTLQTTEIGESLAYEIALRLVVSGETRAARDAFVDVATRWPYPKGTLFDDALYRASELDEKLGRYEVAAQDLERMLDEREVAQLSGSYQRPRYSPALLRLAILYRDRLKDKDRARQAFHRLYADFTTSTLRDDALWQEASLWREDGDTGTACERLVALAEDIPDSRYVPCAMQLCPRVKRAKDSRAPTVCHPYILRAAAAAQ